VSIFLCHAKTSTRAEDAYVAEVPKIGNRKDSNNLNALYAEKQFPNQKTSR
jgi:hypothetical protein